MVDGALVTPAALATMVTVPGATPVTSPPALMVATPAKLEAQLNVTPEMAFPLASTAVAENCCVAPTAMVAVRGETLMAARRGTTVRVAGALVTLAAEAVICVVPGPSPVATPLPSTVETVALLLDQVRVVPTAVPLESSAVAANVCL